MAVKTITIDLEAYALLARHKTGGESFSQVIKRHFGPQPTAGRFRALVRSARMSEDALRQVEAQVRARKASPARIVKL
jgi:predicted CopG family antitoxin